MPVITVKQFLTHENPDIDDVVAIFLAVFFGDDLGLKGASQASVSLDQNRSFSGKTAEELEAEGIVWIGAGGGRFDEHPHGNRPRKLGESATTLMAKYLGLIKDTGLKPIIDYAHRMNSFAQATEFDLSLVTKLAFRHRLKTNPDESVATATEVLDAALFFLKAAHSENVRLYDKKAAEGTIVYSMDDIIALWVAKTLNKPKYGLPTTPNPANECKATRAAIAFERRNEITFKHILNYALNNQKKVQSLIRAQKDPFDLAVLVQSAFLNLCIGSQEECDVVTKQIVDAAHLFLTAMHRKEFDFHVKCSADLNASTTLTGELYRKNGGPNPETILIVSVISDSLEMPKYARWPSGGNAGVVIKRETTGNTQIFLQQNLGLNLIPVIRRLRIEERELKGLTDPLPDDVLISEGTVDGAREWYFDKNNILNGSPTAKLEPTKIPRARINSIVQDELQKQLDVLGRQHTVVNRVSQQQHGKPQKV